MKNITKDELLAEIATGKKVVVDYYATWCGPCKMLAPLLERIEKEQQDVSFYKVDIEQEQELTLSQEITGVPTLQFYKGGTLQHRSVGAVSQTVLLKTIEEKLA